MTIRRETTDQVSLVAAVEQATDSIVITDTMGAIQYVNPAFSAMTGQTSAEAVGHHLRILKSGRQSPESYKQLWDTIISGQRWQGELVNRRKDGTLYCEEMQITPVRNSLGEIVSFIAIKRNVTERRASEDAKAFLATIVEATEDAIVACSPDGKILSWNRGAELLSGFKSEEVIGHPATAYVLPEYQSLLADCMRRTAGGESVSRSKVLLTTLSHTKLQRADAISKRDTESVRRVVLEDGCDRFPCNLIDLIANQQLQRALLSDDVKGVVLWCPSLFSCQASKGFDQIEMCIAEITSIVMLTATTSSSVAGRRWMRQASGYWMPTGPSANRTRSPLSSAAGSPVGTRDRASCVEELGRG